MAWASFGLLKNGPLGYLCRGSRCAFTDYSVVVFSQRRLVEDAEKELPISGFADGG